MRIVPNMTVLECGDATDVESVLDVAQAVDGPVYVRMLRGCAEKVVLGGTRIERFIDPPDAVGLVAISDDIDTGVVATGSLLCPGCEVMGVEPSPFKWLAFEADSLPPNDGTRVVNFELDPIGEVMGVEPSPFRVLLSSRGELLGELDFGPVGGAFPGPLGSLSLGELGLTLPDRSSLGVEYFDIYDADDTVTLGGTRLDLRVTERVTSNERQVDLVVNSAHYGAGGFASGSITCPGCEVMGVELVQVPREHADGRRAHAFPVPRRRPRRRRARRRRLQQIRRGVGLLPPRRRRHPSGGRLHHRDPELRDLLCLDRGHRRQTRLCGEHHQPELGRGDPGAGRR